MMRRRKHLQHKPMSLSPFHHHKSLFNFDKSLSNMFDNFTSFMEDHTPRINVREEEQEYIVEAEVPGLSKDELEVRYEHGALTISGEQKQDNKIEREDYVSMERQERKYQRTIPFDSDNIDDANITANLENGVLYVKLPKKHPGFQEDDGKVIDID